jgi:hypothetical protein
MACRTDVPPYTRTPERACTAMGLTAYTQIAATASNIVFFLVFVVAYYKMIKMNRRTLDLQEWQATAVGRPQVIVDDDFSRLPDVDISIRNISEGAAKDITFEFSAPVERSDGTVISDLAYFKDELDFLAPGKEITLHWDRLDTLLPFLEEKGLEGGQHGDHPLQGPRGHVVRDRLEPPPLDIQGRHLRALQGHRRAGGRHRRAG